MSDTDQQKKRKCLGKDVLLMRRTQRAILKKDAVKENLNLGFSLSYSCALAGLTVLEGKCLLKDKEISNLNNKRIQKFNESRKYEYKTRNCVPTNAPGKHKPPKNKTPKPTKSLADTVSKQSPAYSRLAKIPSSK